MKRQACAVLLGAALLLGSQSAWAQEATYVFSYEGFRYTQRENETVLTQTNLDEHEDLLHDLGTTKEAVLASYIASGIVMEVIPDDGGQIAVSVTDAGSFADVKNMSDLSDERRLSFLAQFEMSGLYETCAFVDTTPECVRLTSSAMYASMPVYSLRYATLHLGRLYMIEQTIVGREPTEKHDARMERLLEGVKLLSSVSEATPTPQATATPQPTATPEPVVGEAEVETTLDKKKVLVSVKDQGPGISEEDQKYVFDRFFKTDTTRNMDKTGSGIGLAIVREFLQAHGETITVKSEKGRGATFVFSLKLAKKEN